MLQISKKTNYGLNFLIEVAKQNSGKPVSLSEIAAKIKLPKSFLAKIAANLVKNEIIESKEGVKGGYILAKEPSEIPLTKILSTLEVKTQNFCAGSCDFSCGCQFCTTRDVVKPLEKEIKKELGKKTLADFIQKPNAE